MDTLEKEKHDTQTSAAPKAALGSLASRVLDVCRRAIRVRQLPSDSQLDRFLGNTTLLVADVGSSGGPEGRWRDCARHCHFLTFDPDPRVDEAPSASSTNFKVGLWSGETERTLFLTAFQNASSVFEPNAPVLEDFLSARANRVVDTQSLRLTSMAAILPGDVSPDFIKVDAEGADLEILRGSAKFLESTSLGVQVEVSFIERYKQSPYFSDIDPYLRSFGFSLFQLSRAHWIRSNGLIGVTSRPQLVWANAVYLLDWTHLSSRFTHAEPATREQIFRKFVLLLLVYHHHDYAIEVTDRLEANGSISDTCAMQARRLITRSLPNPAVLFLRRSVSAFLALVALVVLSPVASLRSRAGARLKYEIRKLMLVPLALVAREGPYESCISDDDE